MPKSILAILILSMAVFQKATAAVLISGVMVNPPSTDGVNEYVQLVATDTIDFSVTPYTVVVSNNGTATANGWAAGGALTYAFTITTGNVAQGDVFYVGGTGLLLNGAGSADLSGLTWLRTINTSTTGGDGGIGAANSAGVMGNGGANADGVAVFSSGTVTGASVPVDAIFYGTGVGAALSGANGYRVPTSDLYAGGGLFGSTGNTFIFGDQGSGFLKLTGTYNPDTDTWDVARTGAQVALTTSSPVSAIASGITVAAVPEPSRALLLGLGMTWIFARRRRAH